MNPNIIFVGGVLVYVAGISLGFYLKGRLAWKENGPIYALIWLWPIALGLSPVLVPAILIVMGLAHLPEIEKYGTRNRHRAIDKRRRL